MDLFVGFLNAQKGLGSSDAARNPTEERLQRSANPQTGCGGNERSEGKGHHRCCLVANQALSSRQLWMHHHRSQNKYNFAMGSFTCYIAEGNRSESSSILLFLKIIRTMKLLMKLLRKKCVSMSITRNVQKWLAMLLTNY